MRFPTLPGFFVCAVFLGGAARLFADDDPAHEVAAQWRGVTRVHGAITVEYHEWVHESGIREGQESDKREAAEIQFAMVLDHDGNTSSMVWRAESASITGSIHGSTAFHINKNLGPSTVEAEYSGVPVSLGDFTLSLDPETGVWQMLSPGKLERKYPIVSQFSGDDPDVVTDMSDSVPSVVFNGTVAGKAGAVTAVYRDEYALTDQPLRGVSNVGQLQFWPEFDDVEVEVTIDGYDEWRPLGSIESAGKVGNSLVAHAVLKPKNGKIKNLPEVESFRFKLMDTSREPGVCMNWPLNATDHDFDLKFADPSAGSAERNEAARKFYVQWGLQSQGDFDAASLPSGPLPTATFGKVSDNGQKLEYSQFPKDKDGRPFADALVECFDFGAKAELQVICRLKDGREIVGLMKGDGADKDLVRLPKMSRPGWIAESWRKEHQVAALPDDDDNEKIEGQKNNGDGFTLYEEYRGWVEKGRHIEGDPKGKDFFVLNLIDADARGGIALFARLSKLRVHSRLRDGKEMSQEERVMNGNHRDAPHRVDQHGVAISHEAGGAGGYNVGVEGVDKTKAGRPRNIRFVYVETHHPDGLFAAATSAEYYLSERDAQSAYDRGVAHELFHAVGVDHHGEQLWSYVKCYFQGAAAPLNPTHRARFTTDFGLSTFQTETLKDWHGDRGATISLLWEDTRREVVEDSVAAYEAELAKHRADYRTESYINDTAATAVRMAGLGVKHDAAFWAEYGADNLSASDFNRVIRVGKLGGTDSGNELCVMRYYFANAYRVAGRDNAYYLIRPGAGANRAGRELCTSPEGTGTNAKSYQPQSRFGGAYSGRGNCFGDICPNDAIPPRSVILQ